MLRKIIFMLICLVFVSTIAMADPFLGCDDPDPAECVTSYVLVINGAAEIETPAPLHYDLSDLAEGPCKIDIQAKNVWGVSTPFPFSFAKKLPSVATGVIITID